MVKNINQLEKQNKPSITMVEVSLPSAIQINLVQASELRHYEIALWLGSLFSSATVGFWTAYLTVSPHSRILFWVSVVFSIFTIIFIFGAWHYRLKLKNGEVKKVAPLDVFK